MDSAADRTRFLLEDPKRLRIAEWCAEAPVSHGELASRLGEDYGGLSAPKTMSSPRWKALVKAGKAGSHKAQLWRLSKSWLPAVEAARREFDEHATNLLQDALGNLDLLMVRLPELRAACETLQKPLGEVEWAAPVQGEGIGLVIGTSRRDQGRAAVRLINRLLDAGVSPVRLSIDAPLSAEQLAHWAKDISALGQDAPALSSPSES